VGLVVAVRAVGRLEGSPGSAGASHPATAAVAWDPGADRHGGWGRPDIVGQPSPPNGATAQASTGAAFLAWQGPRSRTVWWRRHSCLRHPAAAAFVPVFAKRRHTPCVTVNEGSVRVTSVLAPGV